MYQVKELEESSKPGSLWLNKVTNDQNEQFARLNEDPLYHLRKRQQMQRKKIMSNPVKMQMAKDKAIQALCFFFQSLIGHGNRWSISVSVS